MAANLMSRFHSIDYLELHMVLPACMNLVETAAAVLLMAAMHYILDIKCFSSLISTKALYALNVIPSAK